MLTRNEGQKKSNSYTRYFITTEDSFNCNQFHCGKNYQHDKKA